MCYMLEMEARRCYHERCLNSIYHPDHWVRRLSALSWPMCGEYHIVLVTRCTGCPNKNALSEPRLLPVVLSPQLRKQLISRPGVLLGREQHWKQSWFWKCIFWDTLYIDLCCKQNNHTIRLTKYCPHHKGEQDGHGPWGKTGAPCWVEREQTGQKTEGMCHQVEWIHHIVLGTMHK